MRPHGVSTGWNEGDAAILPEVSSYSSDRFREAKVGSMRGSLKRSSLIEIRFLTTLFPN